MCICHYCNDFVTEATGTLDANMRLAHISCPRTPLRDRIAADEQYHADAVQAELANDPAYADYLNALEELNQEELNASATW